MEKETKVSDQKRYASIREEIISRCKSESACVPEFKKLVEAKDESEFIQVLIDNILWCQHTDRKNKILTCELVERFDPSIRMDKGIYVKWKQNINTDKSVYLFGCEIDKVNCSGNISYVRALDGGTISNVRALDGGTISDVQALDGGTISNVWALNGGNISYVHALNGGNISNVCALDGGTISNVRALNGGNISYVRVSDGGNISYVHALNGGNISLIGSKSPDKISVNGSGIIRDLGKNKIYVYKSRFEIVECNG